MNVTRLTQPLGVWSQSQFDAECGGLESAPVRPTQPLTSLILVAVYVKYRQVDHR